MWRLCKNELEEWKAKANEYLEGWQRARADYANYKKRVDREQAQVYQNASTIIIRRFLEVMDDLDLALKNRPNEGDGAGWAEGVELIYRKLSAILEAEGVSVINTDGSTSIRTYTRPSPTSNIPTWRAAGLSPWLKKATGWETGCYALPRYG